MGQKQFLTQLKLRKEELEKEVKAIKVLIASYEEDAEPDEVVEESPSSLDDNIILAKGNMSWEEYSIYLLGKLGGEAKASDVADLAVKANPKEKSEKTVRNAISVKLSKNYRNGKIDATEPTNKKEGNTYRIKQKMRRTIT